MKKYHVAVVGATGAVGNEMISILEERDFPVGKLTLLASERSLGKELTYRGKAYTVQVLKEDSFTGIEVGLFSAGGSISQKFALAGNGRLDQTREKNADISDNHEAQSGQENDNGVTSFFAPRSADAGAGGMR